MYLFLNRIRSRATKTLLLFYCLIIMINNNFTGWTTRAWTLLSDNAILVTTGLAAIASLSIGASGHHGGSLGWHW